MPNSTELEEVDASLAAAATRVLRRHVGEAGRKRVLPRRVWVGVVDGERREVPQADWYDAGMRADVVGWALAGIGPGTGGEGADPQALCAWVTRSGELEQVEADLVWLAAARAAFGRHGVPLAGFFVIARHGWVEVLGGATAEFSRVRPLPDQESPSSHSCTGTLECIRSR